MREIIKGFEPVSLTTHRNELHSDFDNYTAKKELRHALVSEQRGLCCYCMARISAERGRMKIEHWHCQAHYPAEQLSYRNLLGACLGEEGKPYELQHCDTRKGNQDLLWNPANFDVSSQLSYRPDGTIESDHGEFNRQVNEVLNLNVPFLKNNRKGVLDAVLEWWKHHRHAPKGRIKRKIDKYAPTGGQLTPFCQVAIWWLSRKLARMR